MPLGYNGRIFHVVTACQQDVWSIIADTSKTGSATALIQRHFNFLRRLFQNLMQKTKVMCQNLFTGRIVETLLKSSLCLLLYHNLKIRLSVPRKDPLFYQFFTF